MSTKLVVILSVLGGIVATVTNQAVSYVVGVWLVGSGLWHVF